MPIDNIPARLRATAARLSDEPAYYVKTGDSWHAATFAHYARQVDDVARALIALGLEAGDTTCIVGFNRPEWVIFDLATMRAGGAPAGIYTTSSPSEVQYIIDHAEAGIVLLEDRAQWEKVRVQLNNLPKLRTVVMMRDAGLIEHEKVLSWEAFLARAEDTPQGTLEAREQGLEEDQIATLIYTSGTTGPPKAVMLSHKNLTWTATRAVEMADLSDSDCSLSYLPLSHIAEQMFSIHAPITTGYPIYFAESLLWVAANLAEVQPTVIFGVPRIWEKFYAKLSTKMAGATGVKAKLLSWARGVGTQWTSHKGDGSSPSAGLRIQYALAHKLIFSKVKNAIGFDETDFFVSGAAPVSAEILRFFASLDMLVYEVYGQSEDCGPTTVNRPGMTRLGSVGTSFPGVDVKIAEDGEIVVRGKNVFAGYLHDQEATDATLVDGWLQSGDLGAFDAQGYLSITGRKKDILITAGGKNIAPKNLESDMKDLPLVAEAVCIGDRRPFLSALICLDDEAAEAFCSAKGIDVAQATTSEELRQEVQKGIDAMNAKYAQVESIRKFVILPRMLTMEDDELTPTLKVKRANVNKNWDETIEGIYAS